MGMGTAYGQVGTNEERLGLLHRAWELGYTNWDTDSSYGDCEVLIGKWFKLHTQRRADIFLATKLGIRFSVSDKGEWDIRADKSSDFFNKCLGGSLQKMGVDHISLFYIHRLDPEVPIEKTIKLMVSAKRDGEIKAIAYAAGPVDAVQVEYDPFQLDIDNEKGTDLLSTYRELDITVFAYPPLARGFLTGQITSTDNFAPDDIRRLVPRFSPENLSQNLELLGCTPGQLAIAWLSAQDEDVIPIPGIRKVKFKNEKAEVAGHHNSPGCNSPGFFAE
ncbi:NADP-dependent oxidoreductase domain-containing protein [Xylariaceae sp. FL0804]|nr:NADP-dependent oxidoreductase domain-containing protein [Xylariaceae sp. FL0804]